MKKIFLAIAIVLATGSFVSCNDNDENAEVLQEQIDQQLTTGENQKVNSDDED